MKKRLLTAGFVQPGNNLVSTRIQAGRSLAAIKLFLMQIATKLKSIVILLLLTSSTALSQHIKSDFSHIEIIIDSASFEKLIANEFISSKLAHCSYDTTLLSPLVLSYYINGQNNFIHFNPSRGYFATQRGTAYIIFQTRLPGQGKLLEEQWRRVALDSIIRYDFESPDFTLTEIVYTHHDRLSKKENNNLIPMLSSYSVDSYKNWGFGDSTEVSMKQFLARQSHTKNKLFESIISIELTLTQKELKDLIPVLELAGYRKKKKKFFKDDEPTIAYVVNNNLNVVKVTKMILGLSENTGKQSFNFGAIHLLLKKNKAEFSFSKN